MTTKKPTAPAREILERLAADDDLDAIAAMSLDDVKREIREAGGDPDAIAERMTAFVKTQIARRERLAWQTEAAERLARARASADERASRRSAAGPRSRDELLERLAALRTDPRLSAPAAALFKGRTADESSDAELELLLEELELLASMHDEKP